MKNTTLFLALAAGIALNTAALASGFNERGENFIAGVQPGNGAALQSVTRASQGFNERGVNFIAEVPAATNSPSGKVYITSTGFNDRSSNSIN